MDQGRFYLEAPFFEGRAGLFRRLGVAIGSVALVEEAARWVGCVGQPDTTLSSSLLEEGGFSWGGFLLPPAPAPAPSPAPAPAPCPCPRPDRSTIIGRRELPLFLPGLMDHGMDSQMLLLPFPFCIYPHVVRLGSPPRPHCPDSN